LGSVDQHLAWKSKENNNASLPLLPGD
jgi:hypothetical protein